MITNKQKAQIKQIGREFLEDRGALVKDMEWVHQEARDQDIPTFLSDRPLARAAERDQYYTWTATTINEQGVPIGEPTKIKLLYAIKVSNDKSKENLFRVKYPYGHNMGDFSSNYGDKPDVFMVWVGGDINDFCILPNTFFSEIITYKMIPLRYIESLRANKKSSSQVKQYNLISIYGEVKPL